MFPVHVGSVCCGKQLGSSARPHSGLQGVGVFSGLQPRPAQVELFLTPERQRDVAWDTNRQRDQGLGKKGCGRERFDTSPFKRRATGKSTINHKPTAITSKSSTLKCQAWEHPHHVPSLLPFPGSTSRRSARLVEA